MSPQVLVTGATGFVGRALLAAAAEFRVRAAVRSRPAAGPPQDQIDIGNIGAATDWSRALEGIDCVVHLAARAHVMRPTALDLAEFERTNVVGTERLARAAAAAGVKRFIFLSSIKVNGESTPERPFRADDVPRPQDDYGRSKLHAEQRLMKIQAESGMPVAIVRSPLVYGPGVRANFLRLLALAHSGLPLPFGSIANARSLVSVWNLSDVICALLRHEQPVNGVVLAADGEDISTSDLIRRLAAIMRRPARLFPLPAGALRALAALTGQTAQINRLCDSLRIDISDTRARLGWSPPYSLDKGLRQTVHWYLQENGLGTAP